MATFLTQTHPNGCQYFENITQSSNEFYSALKTEIEEHNDSDIKCSRVNLSEGGIFSHNREYLRITRRGVSIDVCAAPFAKGFFVSSWVGEKGALLLDLLIQIPLVGPLIARTKVTTKTYFQADTEAMFKMFVNEAIKETVHKMNETKGQRMPAEVSMQQE